MLAKIDFALEQKLALLLAMSVPDPVIKEKLNISDNTLKAYKSDEDFNRLVNLYKDELEADKLMAKVRNNDSMLEYYVKKKLLTLIDILDQDMVYVHERLEANENEWEARDFINGVNSLTNLANVIRQLLRDISWIVNDSERVIIERKRADLDDKTKDNKLTPEMMAQIKKVLKDSGEGV